MCLKWFCVVLEKGRSLFIQNANYGRRDKETCPSPDATVLSTPCVSTETSTVQLRCALQHTHTRNIILSHSLLFKFIHKSVKRTSNNAFVLYNFSCNGKGRCPLHAANSQFRDRCPNISKYLEVTYSCQEPGEYFQHKCHFIIKYNDVEERV